MPTDISRITFNPSKHYVAVRLQQGRVELDADWNEETDILRYLSAHPQTTDTIDGVVEWWLTQGKTRATLPRITRALGQLVRRGLLLKQQATDGETHYRLNRLKLRAIGKHLKASKHKKKLKRVGPPKTPRKSRLPIMMHQRSDLAVVKSGNPI